MIERLNIPADYRDPWDDDEPPPREPPPPRAEYEDLEPPGPPRRVQWTAVRYARNRESL